MSHAQVHLWQAQGVKGAKVAAWVLSTAGPSSAPPPFSSTCTTTKSQDTELSMAGVDEGGDPWSWDVDRVVRELCTEQRSWQSQSTSERMPEPINLENGLREHEVDGPTLLTLTESLLRETLGVRKLREVATFNHMIAVLRSMSPEYISWQQKYGRYGDGSANRSILEPGSFQHSSSPPRSMGNKRRKIEGGINDVTSHDIVNDVVLTAAEHSILPPPTEEPSNLHGNHLDTTSNARKRKRIAPTLIDSSVDLTRDREVPTQADVVRLFDPHNVEPGVIFRGDDGKKRLIPATTNLEDLARRQKHVSVSSITLNQGGKVGLEAAEFVLRSAPFNKPHHVHLSVGYLGKTKCPVDNIFYGNADIGSELPPEEVEEFALNKSNISNAHRLYVHGLMKHYLKTQPKSVSRKNETALIVQPYLNHLKPRFTSPSLTVFRSNGSGTTVVTRESLKKWPELDPDVPKPKSQGVEKDDERHAHFYVPDNPNLEQMLGGPNSFDNWDPEFHLEKYKHLEDDKVLPLYGDSDEDGEYDLETWKEIEEERGTIDKPMVPLRGRHLSQDEISQAIDEGIALLVVKWHTDKLPKRQLKAWKLWRKARRDTSFRRQRIRANRQHLDRINNERLIKMRMEILSEIWTSQKQVRKQTMIMEPSIFDREVLIWEISVLESRTEPARPVLDELKIKPKRTLYELQDDEESIQSDTGIDSSEDELDGFIVDDSDCSLNEGLLNLTEGQLSIHSEEQGEDDDAPMDIDSSDDEDELKNRSKPSTRSDSQQLHESHNVKHISNAIDDANDILSSPAQSPKGAYQPDISKISPDVIVQAPPADADLIDLTMLTSDASGVEISPHSKNNVNVATPKQPGQKLKLKLKVNGSRASQSVKKENSIPKSGSAMITISDSDEIELPHTPPPLHDVESIAKYSYRLWAKAGDLMRFLISFFYTMNVDSRAILTDLFGGVDADTMWESAVDVMESFPTPQKVPGMDASTFKSYTGVIRLFELFLEGEYRHRKEPFSQTMVAKLKSKSAEFPKFHEICDSVLTDLKRGNTGNVIGDYSLKDGGGEEEEDDDIRPAIRRKLRIPSPSEPEQDVPNYLTPHKVRKRQIKENAQARELRALDQERLREQDQRRRILRTKLNIMGSEGSNAKFIINDGKFEHESFMYVNENIAKRIKPHQVDGVRFLWDQIISSKSQQGCLLAHTMGLGKTMQSITLLVAIVEAVRDESTFSLIPPNLRESRTLVLSPPGLIDNWMDEFLIWAPEGLLGNLRKVDSSIKSLEARLDAIGNWYDGGGVLIMGYEMFRSLIHNKETKSRGPPLTPEAHAEVLKHLQEGPNIVIADEAHKMKNVSSSITTAASKFRTGSRIALTGSPLANNIVEYHSMIEWVAPNYLGPIAEFRAKYVEPIQQGLYHDSSPYERRRSLKMLGVLKADLQPKVHRADMSVLRNDLKPKTEFVITVGLTDLQIQAYRLYVRSMMEKSSDQLVDKDGKIHQTTLWHWLGILSLLCNHPEIFKAKLLRRKEDAQKVHQSINASDGDVIPGAIPAWKVGVSHEITEKEIKLFDSAKPEVHAFENSNKVLVLLQILDASRDAGDKVLIFSQSLDTLNYLESMCSKTNRKAARLDGSTPMANRQGLTKQFNTGDTDIYLISTTAGGLGLNLPGANRVIILDFKFNPIHEEQAIGRAYRIGQKKPVFIYRFIAGGTFEGVIHNTTIFKKQLASRVVDKKNPIAEAKKRAGDYLFMPKDVEQQDLSSFRGMDPVLDRVLDSQTEQSTIRSIATTDIFERHDSDQLTAEEQREVEQLVNDEKLKRSNPTEYQNSMRRRAQAAKAASSSTTPSGKSPRKDATLSRQAAQVKTPMETYRQMQAAAAPFQHAPPLKESAPDQTNPPPQSYTSVHPSVGSTIPQPLRAVPQATSSFAVSQKPSGTMPVSAKVSGNSVDGDVFYEAFTHLPTADEL